MDDGFVAQALKAIQGACDNAANSEDRRLNASLMAAYLDLNTEPGKMSALHVVVRWMAWGGGGTRCGSRT